MDQKTINREYHLKSLTPQSFLALGNGHVAYIRSLDVNGNKAYAIHGADGTVLTLVDSLENAISLARQNDLDPVTLQ
ncbi:MAG: DUF1150 family protein [Pseudomonadota bacterium]